MYLLEQIQFGRDPMYCLSINTLGYILILNIKRTAPWTLNKIEEFSRLIINQFSDI